MNNVIEEYLALVERTVYQSDLDAFDALEQLEDDTQVFRDEDEETTSVYDVEV